MAVGNMNDAEKQLINLINKGNIAEAKTILTSGGVDVDCLDEHGMTPLMHAAYKAQVEMAELLLAHGADVNSNLHESGYTTLMFGALSGSLPILQVLLQAGANVNKCNDIGRTAAQMAGFVGHHESVSLINNFISRDDLLYYTKPQGFEKVGKLDAKLVPSLQAYVTMTNLNPVKLVSYLSQHMGLVENYKSVHKVLDLKAESYIKKNEMNEVMAIKMHYFAVLVKTCGRWHEGLDGKDGVNGLIKSLVRGRSSDGFPLAMEEFIRQAIREFDYPQCTIFRQIVEALAKVEKGRDPTALSVLTQSINGLQSADFSKSCSVCGEKKSLKKCAACKKVGYCSVDCQKLHWSTHKKQCKRLAEEYAVEQAMEEKIKRLEEEEKAKREEDKAKQEKEKSSQNSIEENQTHNDIEKETNGENRDTDISKESEVAKDTDVQKEFESLEIDK